MRLMLDIKGQSAALANIEDVPKQVRYATSLAINETMLAVQEFTLSELLPDKFTLRSKGAPWQKPGTKYGFNLKFASRTNLVGVLGSQADWLDLQERGGTKQADGHRIAIPTPFWKERDEIMRREKKPAALFKLMQQKKQSAILGRKVLEASRRRKQKSSRKRSTRLERELKMITSVGNVPFEIKGQKEGIRAGIYVRSGKARLPIHPLFLFEEQVPIQLTLAFEPTAGSLATQLYPQKFALAFQKAISTARRI